MAGERKKDKEEGSSFISEYDIDCRCTKPYYIEQDIVSSSSSHLIIDRVHSEVLIQIKGGDANNFSAKICVWSVIIKNVFRMVI